MKYFELKNIKIEINYIKKFILKYLKNLNNYKFYFIMKFVFINGLNIFN